MSQFPPPPPENRPPGGTRHLPAECLPQPPGAHRCLPTSAAPGGDASRRRWAGHAAATPPRRPGRNATRWDAARWWLSPGGYPVGCPCRQQTLLGRRCLRLGWKKFTANVGPILIAMLVFLLVGAVIYGIQVLLQAVTAPEATVVTGENGFVVTSSGGGFFGVLLSMVFAIISFIWGYIVQAAFARGGLALVEGRALELGELFSFNKLGRIILAGIILSVLTFIGFLLCIILV